MAKSIPELVRALKVGNDDSKARAAGALGNRVCNNPGNRVAIAAAGAIEPLVALLKTGNESAKWFAAGVLGNLAHNNDDNKVAIATADAIPLLTFCPKTRWIADRQD